VDAAFDVVGFGMSSVDHLCVVARHPRLDSKQPLQAYEVQPGGQVPTALVALQRWGLKTAYLGSFGDDPGGILARSALALEGVDLSASVARRNVQQQVSVILIDEITGERSVLWQRVPALRIEASELSLPTLASGKLLLMDAVDLPSAILAARTARQAGRLVVLDIDVPAAGVEELLSLTDVLITSPDFPVRLTGIGDIRQALRTAAKFGPWFVAATLGPGGALAVVHGELHYAAAHHVVAVDSTGAGDIFHAGCIYGILRQWPVSDTLRFAAAAAALKCEKLGGRPGSPSLARAYELAKITHRDV
jgi:sugar/nucleoside kinase (ribokinase family)